MNTKGLINTSYVCLQHSYLHIFNAVVLDKKIIWVLLYGVSQFNRFSRALEVSLLFYVWSASDQNAFIKRT